MKRIFLLLPVCLLHVPDAYGACPSMERCHGSSLDVVADCCAKCDGIERPGSCDVGVTADQCAINAALDAVNAAGGGEVIIPPGICIISPAGNPKPNPPLLPYFYLHLYSNVTIRGEGPKSILQVRADNPDYLTIFDVTGCPPQPPCVLSNVTLKDFAIDQNPSRINQGDNIYGVAPQYVIAPSIPQTGITVSGMFFDPTASMITSKAASRDLLKPGQLEC
jgi:hypothetical protein